MSRVLVVGGTGFIGSEVVRQLRERGDDVVILSRREEAEGDPRHIAGVERLLGDYMAPEAVDLSGFDGIIFAAGHDIRHVAAGDDDEAFWGRVQRDGVPAFAAAAKKAGVARFVQVGSYYHQLHPEWAANDLYIAARKAADEGARALTDETFAAITVNPPSIVGANSDRGLRGFARLVSWVRGERAEPGLWGPAGGTNYMSVRSLAQALIGALDRGEPGKAYLVGDESLTYSEYWQWIADAAGSSHTIGERDEEHPFQPDRFIVQGRGNVIAYEPDAAETALLGYDRHDVRRELAAIVAAVDALPPRS